MTRRVRHCELEMTRLGLSYLAYVAVLTTAAAMRPGSQASRLTALVLTLVVVIIGLTSAVRSPDKARRSVFNLGLALPVAVLGAVVGFNPEGKEFYEATAQVVPVLFLALAFETRDFRHGAVLRRQQTSGSTEAIGQGRGAGFAVLQIALYLILAEALSLSALGGKVLRSSLFSTQEDLNISAATISAALTATAFILTMLAVAGPVDVELPVDQAHEGEPTSSRQ
jgi:hypothetical protein